MGNTNYSKKNISFTKFYGNYVYYFHNQLTIKAHEYHSWQNYSSCRINQAQASLFAKPSWVRPTHTQISAIGKHVNWSTKFQQRLNSWSPFLSGPNLSNQIRK